MTISVSVMHHFGSTTKAAEKHFHYDTQKRVEVCLSPCTECEEYILSLGHVS